jgi:hypothetical protein
MMMDDDDDDECGAVGRMSGKQNQSAALSTNKSYMTNLGPNSGRFLGKPTTNRLRYGTASQSSNSGRCTVCNMIVMSLQFCTVFDMGVKRRLLF